MVQDMRSPRFISALTKNTVALVLAGGRGSRLHNLTDWNAKPAVQFGGKFRIIDFPLSNCINSGIRRIGVVTQYKAHTLIEHIQKGWGFLRGEFNEFVALLPAQQRIQEEWYRGTADAVFQNIDILRGYHPEYIVILAGDHVYKMDYGEMLAYHVSSEADMTVGCVEVPVSEGSAFGIMTVDEHDRIVKFDEKPKNPSEIPGKPGRTLASMGIYVFNANFLYEQLIRDADTKKSSHDFGHDIIPYLIDRYRVFAHRFERSCVGMTEGGKAYWRDVGTIDAYWQANMEMVGVVPDLDLYDKSWPIWTYQEQLPPAKFVFDDDGRRGQAIDSMVSGGCIISGALVHHSLLFSDIRVGERSEITDSVILSGARIGQNVKLNRVVLDNNCHIPDGMEIGFDHEADAHRFHVSPGGITLVTPDMLGQSIHHIR